MNYFKKLRIKIGNYLLNRKLKKRNYKPIICNLKHAKKIGIIYDSLSNEDLSAIKKVEKSYINQNIKVELLGFSNAKIIQDNLIGDNNHHYVCIKDLNWLFQPKSELLKEFIAKDFDILINLYTNEDFCTEVIVRSSYAKFKVGPAHLNKNMHDLMIDGGEKKNNILYLNEQISYYLGIINS
ncbi:hypothetical protein OM075_10540 [Marinilabiliaceae bacterium AAT]|uniref:Uncharacterized protein n=1 Tax=Plebeiibacterium sediminum TaxID=2992112 RepID=A0AAE3M468_9BACT|nr:hypothetical protein [Plebeiobacterium sediminum]